MKSQQTNDLEVMTDIIKLLKNYSTKQDEQDKYFYNAIFYLFKNEIYKFPRNIIIFYIFASYNISLKVLELGNEVKIHEHILDIYNKIQTKESIPLPPILQEFVETLPKYEFCFTDFSNYFNKCIMIAESDLIYFLNFSFSVRNPYDYIKEYISTIVNWLFDQTIEKNNYQIVFHQLYEETKELLCKFQQNTFYFITRPEIVAIVSISIACENLQIDIDKIFGSNQIRFFYDFLLPNCNKEKLHSKINEVLNIFKKQFPELMNKKEISKKVPIENINEKRTFPLEIPIFIDLCCPPPPLELMNEIFCNEKGFDIWTQCPPKVPPPNIEFLYNFRNENETFDNIQNKSDDLTEIKLNPIDDHQINRSKILFNQLFQSFFGKQSEAENPASHIALSEKTKNEKEENEAENLNQQSKKEPNNAHDALLSSDDKSKNDVTKKVDKSLLALPNSMNEKKQKLQDTEEEEKNRDKDTNESKVNNENEESKELKTMSIFFIKRSNNRKYKLDVKPNDKVIDIKTELKNLTGLYVKQQQLFYNDSEMENDKKMSDYSIPNGATLDLFSKNEYYSQVIIKPPIGRPIYIEVSQSTTIKDIKDEIFKLRGIPQSKQQILSFDKRPLKDNSIALNTIYSYNTADLKYARKKTRKLNIKPTRHDLIQLLVDENDTIDDIKYEAGDKIGHNIEYQDSELIYSGIKLENDRKIKDYLIPLDAILYFHVYTKSGIIVYIKNGCGDFIPIEVTPKEKIISIKKQIQEIEGILPCQQELFFDGKSLLDENEIQFYRIDSFSVIDLKFSKDSQVPKQIKISIKLPSIDKPFQTNVDPMIQVKELKSIIESIIGLKSNEQMLAFQCKQLEDDFTLHHYSITDNSVILVAPFEKKQIKITVNLPSRKTLTFYMNLTDFIKELKMKINNQTGFPIDKQVLVCKCKFLKDDDSFQAQKITSDSTVDLYLIERGGVYIQIKISSSKYLPIEVKPDDTLLYIKNEIFKREGIPINERTLSMSSDDTKISKFGYEEYCTLSYMPYKQGDFQIFLKTLTGEHITLYAHNDEKISEFQNIIELMEGIKIEDQRIIYSGKQLYGDKTFYDYGIKKDSTLHLVLRLRG